MMNWQRRPFFYSAFHENGDYPLLFSQRLYCERLKRGDLKPTMIQRPQAFYKEKQNVVRKSAEEMFYDYEADMGEIISK